MNFFEKFAALTAAGVVFHLTMRAAGTNMQLELLPVADPGKTGISLLPRTFVGTAQELDAEIPSFLDSYLVTTSNLREQMDAANAALKKAELEAQEAVKKAAEVKTASKNAAKSSSAPTKSLSKTVPGLASKRGEMSDGLLGEDDGDGEDGEGADDTSAETSAVTANASTKSESEDSAADTVTGNLFV